MKLKEDYPFAGSEAPKIKVFKIKFCDLQMATDGFNVDSLDYGIFKSRVERIDYMDKVITENTWCVVQVKIWGNDPFIENQWEYFIYK